MRVSVGIPFYNNEETLANAIRSVFAQTFQDWELILVDDGSYDRSLAIAQTVEDSRVRLVSDGLNKNVSFRLNQISRLARGEYIASMHADDLMHPERLMRQVKYLDANPLVDLVGTGAYTIDSAGNPLGIRGLDIVNASPRAVLAHATFIHPTVVGRAEWFRRNSYDGTFVRAEDHELWCRTSSHSVFATLQESLFFYREGPSVSLDNYLRSCRTDRMIFRKYGPTTVGWSRTHFLILRSHLKGAAYRVFTALRMQHVLVRRRNAPLTEEQRSTALEALSAITRTSVPGLDHE